VPVIFTSAKPDLRDVVDTLKAGAFDFFEKPFETAALANRVEAAMIFHRRLLPVLAEIARIEQLVDGLTKRERQLFDLVLAGKTTKEIAFDLGIRDVTVDFHRRNLYRKMGVNNAVNLAIIIENYRHERMRMAGAIPTL
jgi:two-component system response regulator DctR